MSEKVGKFFYLDEFTVSPTATRRGIDNTPSPEVLVNIKNLCKYVLDPLRERVGKPVVINSGYRCSELNKLVGGAKNSQHTQGEAADIIIPGVSVEEIVKLIRSFALPFDQVIDEFSSWVHVSLKVEGNRGEVLTARKEGKETVYTKVE